MYNRAARRRAERAHDKEVHSRGAPPTVKPTGNHGVEIDRGDDGYIYFTLHGGYLTLTVKWSGHDAEMIADMIGKAAKGEDAKMPEVVRESGLVVPPTGFQL